MDTPTLIREWTLARTAARCLTARLVESLDGGGHPRRSFEVVSTRRADGREFVTRVPLRAIEAFADACDEAREIVGSR